MRSLMVAALAVALCLVCGNVEAEEQGPDDVLKAVVLRLKSSGSLASVIDFVDWQTVYSRASMGSAPSAPRNAEELKVLNQLLFSDPGVFFEKQAGASLESMSADAVGSLKADIVSQIAAQNRRYASAAYEVGKASRQGDTATVELKVNGGPASIPFVKRGSWLLAEFPFRLPEQEGKSADSGGVLKLP